MFTYFLERNERKSVWEIIGKARQGDQSIDGYAELHIDTGDDLSQLTAEKIEELKQKKQALMENGYGHELMNGGDRTDHIKSPIRNRSLFCNLL